MRSGDLVRSRRLVRREGLIRGRAPSLVQSGASSQLPSGAASRVRQRGSTRPRRRPRWSGPVRMGKVGLGTAARRPRDRVRSRRHKGLRRSSRVRSRRHRRPRRSTLVRSRRHRRSSRLFETWRRCHHRLCRMCQVRRPGWRLRLRPVVRQRRVVVPPWTQLDPQSARRPRPCVRPGSAGRHPRDRLPLRRASLRRRPISGPRTFRIRPWLALDPRRSSLSLRSIRSGSWTRPHRPPTLGIRRRRQPQGHLDWWRTKSHWRATLRMQRSSLLPRGPGGWSNSLRSPPIPLLPRVGRFPPMRLEGRKVGL
jgi:hypothetical protein